jgi:radical SAM superfamily enzyme YgiQ (UPF0313 family)
MPAIVLATLNSRYAHASLGLRYLRANLGRLRADSAIREFIVRTPIRQIADELIAESPRIIGLGVYIWNAVQCTALVELLKRDAPEIRIVLGGPEISHETADQRIAALADYVVTGWGDVTFARLAGAILEGPRPLMKVHAGEQPALETLRSPYDEYSDADLAHRNVYVEASRGCPFKCEFCLSALDRSAWPFPLEPLLVDLERLYRRGARHFKFVDRTFNLKLANSTAILEFFLRLIEANPHDPPFLHFELIPDRLPVALRSLIARFPPGVLQFEIGIQTFDEAVQQRVSRRQDNTAAEANLRWLRTQTNAHLHVDLIAGLPGETVESFAAGFDRLVALAPHEIQFGMLKRLRGTPIARHTDAWTMQYAQSAPYQIESTSTIDAATMQRLARFARYWDLVANSGRFVRTLPLMLRDRPFENFLCLSDALYAALGRTHAIANEELYEQICSWMASDEAGKLDARAALADDYRASGARGKLSFYDGARRHRTPVAAGSTPSRQRRHAASAPP